MKLFTLGDSISQGFMSLSAARTDLAYSTLIAQKLGLTPQRDYRFADWPHGGIPVNIEAIMRSLNRRYGPDIQGLEWLTVLETINRVVDQAEDYYERGEGRHTIPSNNGQVEYFHNVAVRGFNVSDAWQVTPKLCRETIEQNRPILWGDGYLSGADNPYYRTALRVLNPSLDPKYDDYSQLKWMEKHAQEEGIENCIIWLGANNALSTVIDLKIRQTPNNPEKRPYTLSPIEKAKERKWNLWHPYDFEADYREFMRQVSAIMAKNRAKKWNVFIATVPLVTIAPLAKGVGETTYIEDKGIYYKYYTFFPFEEDFAVKTGKHLTMQDAIYIDDCIRYYNKTIEACVKEANEQSGSKGRYHIVDIAQALNQIAYKRNAGQPTYDFPEYFRFIHPQVNTKYYHADSEGELKQGGIFSLDGVHPTAIGHGLIAYEFLTKMKEAGVVADTDLDWAKIFANDTLYTQPITLMQEIYGKDSLAKHIVNLIQLFSNDFPLTTHG